MFIQILDRRIMLTFPVIILLAASTLFAQDDKSVNGRKAAVVVTAAAADGHVRFTAPGNIASMQLEVYDEAGNQLFGSNARDGNVLDWSSREWKQQPLNEGSYLCVVTVRSLSGKVIRKLAAAAISNQQVTLKPIEIAQLTLAQAQAVNASGDQATQDATPLTILASHQAIATTVIAHDGVDGQVSRTRGALEFRFGDFFSGSDKEQMRLTEDGNLGLGTNKPQARLDVAGDFHASGRLRPEQGIQFADGTVQTSASSGRQDKDGNLLPNVAGTGTQNKIAKWTDNAGTLGDSGIFEAANGFIGIGTTSPAHPFAVRRNGGTLGVHSVGELFVDRDDRTRSASLTVGTAGTLKWIFGMPSGTDGFQVYDLTNNVSRFFVDPTNGNVGIGTAVPNTKLDVAGNINTSTQYNIGGSPVLNVLGTDNIFAGVNAGKVNTTGFNNSFFGIEAGANNTTACCNSFFGASAGFSNIASQGNAFFGDDAGYSTTGGGNSFFGSSSGRLTTSGANNSFFGVGTGSSNSTGSNNTLIGRNADVGANNLDHATAIGSGAVVSTSDTIALGRANGSDVVDVPGKLQIDTLATAGSTNLCLNSSSRVGTCSSSLRYKTQVRPFLGGLSILNRLRPISFTWKEDGKRDLGLGAEEVERVEPLLTFRNKQGEIEGVKYNQLTAVLINAIKEQQQLLDTERQLLKQQRREIENLKQLVCRNHRNAAACK